MRQCEPKKPGSFTRIIKGKNPTRIATVIFLLPVVLLLSSCVSMPTSSDVQEGKLGVSVRAPLTQTAPGPVKGASPEEILQGFKNACAAGPYDEYVTAKSFLTKQTSKQWDPQAETVVVKESDGLEFKAVQIEEDTARFRGSGKAVLRLGKAGISLPVASELGNNFTLEKEQGEWRISSLPKGIVLSEPAFNNAFIKKSLYYYSYSGQDLIADPRFFSRHEVATQMLHALLKGPSTNLRKIVRWHSISNAGAKVELRNNLASFSIPELETHLEYSEIENLQQQLLKTFSSLPGVNAIELRGQEGELYPFDNTKTSASSGQLAYGIKQKKVLMSDKTAGSASAKVIYEEGSEALLTWPTGGSRIEDPKVVLREHDELLLLREEQAPVTLWQGKDLRPPAVDRAGWIWTGSSQENDQVVVLNSSGESITVKIPEVRGVKSRIVFLALNSTGSRALVVKEISGVWRVETWLVKRDRKDRPVELLFDQEIENKVQKIVSAVWIDEVTPAILVGESTPVVMLYPLNSYQQNVTAPANAQFLVANAKELQIVDAEQTRRANRGQSWNIINRGWKYVTYSG